MDNNIKCPRCNSTNVSTGTKGYGLVKGATGGLILGPIGLMAGLIGSKRIRIDCLLCGHHWDLIREIRKTSNKEEFNEISKDLKDFWSNAGTFQKTTSYIYLIIILIVLLNLW